MLSADEIINHVDLNNNVIGGVRREEMRAKRLLHQATYIFVFNKENKLFVQKRTMIKDYCPGYWDPAPGGVVGYGESYEENAKRELKEEMGIEVPMKHCTSFLFDNYCWGDIWVAEFNGTINDLSLQKEEVDACELMSIDEILGARRKEMTPDGIQALEILLDYQKDSENKNN